MKVELTDDQVRKLQALAVNAAIPVGMGFLHYTPKEFRPEEFNVPLPGDWISLDYVEGRMTKLSVRRNEDGFYEIPDHPPRPNYQSWCRKYATYEDLVLAAME